jgi:hypothetical protein
MPLFDGMIVGRPDVPPILGTTEPGLAFGDGVPGFNCGSGR